MGDADYLMALELQRQFDSELESLNGCDALPVENPPMKKMKYSDCDDLNRTQNLVHPDWETLDPTPDVQALFRAFDDKFFQGRLKCVILEWSKRMYSCAGICYSRRNRYGMAITIRLSEPLLKLRTRKDLVETLLHEMIHAYCSVLGIREGNGGHGPNFRKIMNTINKVAGTNITVYHSFHDEVDVYKTHWWRCNGICQNRKPFYGYVKRTSNRSPGPNDIWWRQHFESCGGSFLKIKEPDNRKPMRSSNKENDKIQKPLGSDLRSFFPKVKPSSDSFPPRGPTKSNDGGTLLIKPTTTNSTNAQETQIPAKSLKTFGNLSNVVGLKDLDNANTNSTVNTTTASIGTGYSLDSPSSKTTNNNNNNNNRKIDKEKVRNIWSQKYLNPSDPIKIQDNTEIEDIAGSSEDAKESRIPSPLERETEAKYWTKVDDEIMIREEINSVIDISSDEEDLRGSEGDVKEEKKPQIKLTIDEMQRKIKQEILENSDLSEDDIEIIDADFDDNLVSNNVELADTSLIDDLFGEDTLLKEFKKENSVKQFNSRYHSDPKNDIVTCAICQEKLKREDLSEHLDGCVGIIIKINPLPSTSKAGTSKSKKVIPFYKKEGRQSVSSKEAKDIFKKAGYKSEEFENVVDVEAEDGLRRRQGLDTSTHSCPVCAQEVEVDKINEHLDICLGN